MSVLSAAFSLGGVATLVALPGVLGLGCGGGPHGAAPDAGDAAARIDAQAGDSSVIECPVPDADADGYASLACGGDDCDDAAPAIHPGAYDHSGWTILKIDEDGGAPALATGPDGVVHLVYSARDGLRHASSGSDWAPQTIVATETSGASVAVGADGAIHVGFLEPLDDTGSNLEYAVRVGDHWSVEQVASGASSRVAAVAVSAAGQPHLAYELRRREGWYSLEVAARSGGSWVPEIVEEISDEGTAPSIAFTVDAVLHLTAFDSSVDDLLHYTQYAEGWSTEIVDNEAGPSRQALLAHAEDLAVVYGGGHVASWSGRVWTRDGSELLWGSGSLALDEEGGAHLSGVTLVSASEGEDPFVTYLARAGGDEWTREMIDGCDDHLPTAIALDAEEHPVVAYVKDQAMMLAFRDGELDGIDQNCDGVDGDRRDW